MKHEELSSELKPKRKRFKFHEFCESKLNPSIRSSRLMLTQFNFSMDDDISLSFIMLMLLIQFYEVLHLWKFSFFFFFWLIQFFRWKIYDFA